MKLVLGRQTDNGLIDQMAGSWRHGRNAIIQSGKIINEPGFTLLIDTLPGANIGQIVLDSNLVAVFQVNGANSEIYIVDLTNITTRLITSNTDFDFSVDHPISGEYYRNAKGEIVLAWTDNHTSPRIMNIETAYVDTDKLTRLYLKYELPTLDSVVIQDTGGSLLTGSHFLTTAYISIDDSQTQYSPILGPFLVTDNTRAEIGDKYDGAEAGKQSSKSMEVTFTNVDTDYKYLIIALVSRIGGVTTAKQVKKVTISTSTITTTILGSENIGTVSLEDIVIGTDVYDKVAAMTQINNQLFMANLTKVEEESFQLAALDIVVNYETTLEDITATDDNNPKLKPTKGFAHNEIYALFVHLVKSDGTITRGFHIPGRTVAVYNNSDFPEFNGIYENQNVTVAAGSHIDRAVEIGGSSSKIFQFFDTAENTNADTNMQYHENEETYPNSPEFGILANQPIRHHKFPSIGHIKSRDYPSDAIFGTKKLTRLNIKVSNVVLPAGYIGYYISAAKRNFTNSTIIAQDIMLYSGRRDLYGTAYWTTCGNWNIIEPHNGNLFADYGRLRIHAFDLFINRPAVAPNYVEAELTWRNRDISVPYNFGSKTGGSILQSGGSFTPPTHHEKIESVNGTTLTDEQQRQDILVIDNVKGNVAVEVTNPKKRFTSVSQFKYMPGNTSDGLGDLNNLTAEEAASVRMVHGDIFGFNGLTLRAYNGTNERLAKQFTGGVGTAGVPEEVSYLYNLKQYKSSIYEDMFNQSIYLIHSKMAKPIDETTEISIEGGDVIISDMSFICYGPQSPGDARPNCGVRVVRRHIVESVNFASYRYQSSDVSSNFYPETEPFPFAMLDKSKPWNQWAYNKDYSSVNDLNSLIVNNPEENLHFNTGFPYRIVRSNIDQVEERGINNWRSFPIRNYYEMPKNRGEIINIKGIGDILVINQRYAFSRTRNNVKLATSAGEVYAGTGDIFKIPPEELTPTEEGYAGCQHKFGCLLTKAGYMFTDAEQGMVFLLTDKLEEISAKGNSAFFFDSLANMGDNPFNGSGLTIGWDSEYNRIVLSRTDDFTLSYSLDVPTGGWAFDHDYHPDSLFHTRYGLYSFKGGKIYKNDAVDKKATYYDDTIYPTSIVGVFNRTTKTERSSDYQDGGDSRKLSFMFTDIKWKSEVTNFRGGIQTKETLTQLFLYNSFQGTDLIELANFLTPSLNTYNLRKTAGIWHFNKFRDLVIDATAPIADNYLPITGNINANKPFQLKRRFIDHYLAVNFIYDNQPVDGEQRNLYLYEVDANFNPVER